MRATTTLMVLVVLITMGCGEATQPPPDMPPPPPPPADLGLVAGQWSTPDGAGCTFIAGFDGRRLGGISRACDLPTGDAQWSRVVGTYKVNKGDDTLIVTITPTETSCPISTPLVLGARVDGDTLTLVDDAGARVLQRTTASPGTSGHVTWGCFDAAVVFNPG